MYNFILCTLQYLLIMAVILAVGCLGAVVGIRLRKNKNAKLADQKEQEI